MDDAIDISIMQGHWASAPREVLTQVFMHLPLKDRCQAVGAVCAWWRQVALEEEGLLGDLNLCTIPLFSVRALHLPGFPAQRRAFVHWLEARAHVVRACILQAERWEDDTASLHLRVATAQIVGPHLRSLKLVSTGGGQVTSAFLKHGAQLQTLKIDFFGSGNGLPRQLACAGALTALQIQCSSRFDRYEGLGSLTALRELSVVDSDWRRIPPEVCRLPHLTRLFLRFADFEGTDWLPLAEAAAATTSAALASLASNNGNSTAAAGRALLFGGGGGGGTTTVAAGHVALRGGAVAGTTVTSAAATAAANHHSSASPSDCSPPAAPSTPPASRGGGSGAGTEQRPPRPATFVASLRSLTLHGCHLSGFPSAFAELSSLTSLVLDRNGSLPALACGALARGLGGLRQLSLEGCRSTTSLEALADLPLQSLNLVESGVGELPPGPLAAALTCLHWGPPPPAVPAAGSGAGALDSAVARLPGLERATTLRELYLVGGQQEEAERWAGELFGLLPRLRRVCAPRLGWARERAPPE